MVNFSSAVYKKTHDSTLRNIRVLCSQTAFHNFIVCGLIDIGCSSEMGFLVKVMFFRDNLGSYVDVLHKECTSK
jgi:hypothetical protein